MKRAAAGLFFGLLFVFVASNSSYAEPSGCMEKMGKGMHGDGMVMADGMGRHEMRDGGRIWRHLRRLGLDEKQKEAIRDIKDRVSKETIRKRADVQIARMELREILYKDQVDMNAAEAKLKQIASLVTDIRLSHIKAMEEIKARLTPEQREKFKQTFGKWGKWRGNRGERGMRPSCGKKEGMHDHMD